MELGHLEGVPCCPERGLTITMVINQENMFLLPTNLHLHDFPLGFCRSPGVLANCVVVENQRAGRCC